MYIIGVVISIYYKYVLLRKLFADERTPTISDETSTHWNVGNLGTGLNHYI